MNNHCSKRVYTGMRDDWGGHGCKRPATIEINGKWYCKLHTPESEEKRQKRLHEKYQAKQKLWNEKWEKDKYNVQCGDICRQFGIVNPESELPIRLGKS